MQEPSHTIKVFDFFTDFNNVNMVLFTLPLMYLTCIGYCSGYKVIAFLYRTIKHDSYEKKNTCNTAPYFISKDR